MMGHPVTDEEMSVEQAADFRALRASMEEGEVPVSVSEESGPKLEDEIAGLVLLFVGLTKPILPSLGSIYTPEVTQSAATAVAAVCNKRGWLQGGISGEHAEELAAAAILLPLAFATYNGVRVDLKIDQKKDERVLSAVAGAVLAARDEMAANAGGPIPASELGQKTVTFGNAVTGGENA